MAQGDHFESVCTNCGQPLSVVWIGPSQYASVAHNPACRKPTMSVMTMHPRKLGVITNLAE